MLMKVHSTGIWKKLMLKMLLTSILTERPTVPRPKITTVDPLDISATFQAAPKPEIEQYLSFSILPMTSLILTCYWSDNNVIIYFLAYQSYTEKWM